MSNSTGISLKIVQINSFKSNNMIYISSHLVVFFFDILLYTPITCAFYQERWTIFWFKLSLSVEWVVWGRWKNHQHFPKSPIFGHWNNGGKMGLLSKVRQVSGKKKGIKKFYHSNSLSFSVARTPKYQDDLMMMKQT